MALSEDVLIILQEEDELFADWRIGRRADTNDSAQDVVI